MALIKCSECGREISDKAVTCPGCGAPVNARELQQSPQPVAHVRYNPESDSFAGTMTTMVKLAMRAVQALGWKLDQANESLGLVTFQTGISWGSWSGISGSLNIEEVSPGAFRVTGTGKQNLRGGQIIALNIGGEAQGKARKVIELMKQLAAQQPNFESVVNSADGSEHLLNALGYKVTRNGTIWTVREPLGGRVKIENAESLIEYANSKKTARKS